MLIKPFQKILVGIDGSDKSLEAADYSISITKNTNAQLIILNVLETEPWYLIRYIAVIVSTNHRVRCLCLYQRTDN